MANRSFVFTTNNYRQVPVKALGLSEYEYQIHPLYLLLVAFDSEVISSAVVEEEEKTAIAGDFEKGKALVLKFLEMALTYSESYSNDSFRDFVETSKAFLNQRNEKYVILECAEIIQLDGINVVPGMIPDLEEIKTEIETLYAKHLKGEVTEEEFSAMSFYSDFDDICTYYCQVEVEDIDWDDFWTDVVFFDLEE